MKNIPVFVMMLLAVSTALAQPKPTPPTPPQPKVMEEKVKAPSPKDKEKTVIVIEDGKVTINGKPTANLKGRNRIVINGDELLFTPGTKTMQHTTNAKAFLGVSTEAADQGAKVIEVVEGSAAANAGLAVGDIIVQLNTEKITNPESLAQAVHQYRPNTEVTLIYLRDGKEKKTKVTLGEDENMVSIEGNFEFVDDIPHFNFNIEPPMMPRKGDRFVFRGRADGFSWFGANERPKYGLNVEDNPDGDGAKVTSVEAESNAQKAGLQKDDIITAVDDKAIKTVDDLREVLAESRDKTSVAIKLQRNGKAETLTLKVPKKIKTAEL